TASVSGAGAIAGCGGVTATGAGATACGAATTGGCGGVTGAGTFCGALRPMAVVFGGAAWDTGKGGGLTGPAAGGAGGACAPGALAAGAAGVGATLTTGATDTCGATETCGGAGAREDTTSGSTTEVLAFGTMRHGGLPAAASAAGVGASGTDCSRGL